MPQTKIDSDLAAKGGVRVEQPHLFAASTASDGPKDQDSLVGIRLAFFRRTQNAGETSRP